MAWVAVLLVLQDPPGRWDFKPGSWVEMSTGSLRPGATRNVYREDVGVKPPYRPAPFLEGLTEVSRRKDAWQGRPCEVVEYKDENRTVIAWVVDGLKIPARDMAAAGRFVAVPADVVRALRVETRGKESWTSRLDVLELSAPIEAVGRRFDCVLESSSSTTEYPSGTAVLRAKRRWLSADVPGHVVRQDRQCTANPAAVPHDYTTRDELKAYHVER